MRFIFRRATASDADEIANVYWASFRLLTFLPMLHTIEGYRWFIANVILNDYEVTVAEDKSGIVLRVDDGAILRRSAFGTGGEVNLPAFCGDRIPLRGFLALLI